MKQTLDRLFSLEENDTSMRTEALAGATTFLTMSYIVVVHPAILTAFPNDGVPGGIAVQGYTSGEVLQMLTVITILTSAAAMLVMAFYANLPFGLAPGLGINTYFAVTVVGILGVPWETALSAIFVEGVLFIILTATGAREYVIRLFPEPVKLSVGTGIGLLLAITGLQAMGIVTDDPGTLVSLGNVAGDPVAMLSTVGLFLTLGLYARGTRGSILIGVVATTGVGWGLTQAGVVGSGTLAPESIPSAQYNITPLVGAFIEGFTNVEAFVFALVVFTFFFVDFFDTAGTLVGVGQAGGFLDEDGDFPGIDKPLMADAVGTTVGGILGTSTVTTFIESATGIKEGGRTGLTALVVAVLFLCSLLVVPLAAAIPLYASHIALVVVAVLLIRNVVDIRWDDFAHAVPAGLTIMVIPFTYSIAYGIAAGIISYPVVKANQGKVSDIPVGQWILAASFVLYFVVRTSGVLMSV